MKHTQQHISRRARRAGLALEVTDTGWLLRDATGKTMRFESLTDIESWCPPVDAVKTRAAFGRVRPATQVLFSVHGPAGFHGDRSSE
jgi:hypothetical protein